MRIRHTFVRNMAGDDRIGQKFACQNKIAAKPRRYANLTFAHFQTISHTHGMVQEVLFDGLFYKYSVKQLKVNVFDPALTFQGWKYLGFLEIFRAVWICRGHNQEACRAGAATEPGVRSGMWRIRRAGHNPRLYH